jgi:circadian clock protein KaiB
VSSSSDDEADERAPTAERLQLTLFVSGASPRSAIAVRRLRDLCDRHAASGYDLEIVDVYQQPEVVYARGVLALPTLIKEVPLPVQVLIGDFTDQARVLAALGLAAEKDE